MNKYFNRIVSVLILVMAFSAPSLAAAKWQDYSKSSFEKSQEAGEKIVVDVNATWCSTCKAQSIVIKKMIDQGLLEGVTLYSVDFDTEKDFLQQHRVARQSTFLVFHGKKETARSIAETDFDRLSAAILAGLK